MLEKLRTCYRQQENIPHEMDNRGYKHPRITIYYSAGILGIYVNTRKQEI